MTRQLALFAVPLIAAGFAAEARADSARCPRIEGQAIPIEQVVTKAEGLGYAVKEAKRSKGCWKIEGFDRNGAEIEIRFNASTGEVVKPEDWRAPKGG